MISWASSSFGFRGEALPAIASVSELEVETAPADGAGTFIRVLGGEMGDVRDAARRRGTTITVSRLFFNAPARQPFLRSARSEWRGISEVVTALALTRRDVRLSVVHDGKQVVSLPPAPSLQSRLAGLWGAPFAERLVPLDDVQGAIHVSGLIERPADVGTAGRRLFPHGERPRDSRSRHRARRGAGVPLDSPRRRAPHALPRCRRPRAISST